MSETENLDTPTLTASADVKTRNALPVVIPVIIAGATAATAFLVRRFRRPVEVSGHITLDHDEAPASE